MTETMQKTQLADSTWAAIIALLSPAYPDITRNALEKLLDGQENDMDQYIPTKDACRILSCAPTTLWRMEKHGKIHAYRPFPGKLLYSLKEIRHLIED